MHFIIERLEFITVIKIKEYVTNLLSFYKRNKKNTFLEVDLSILDFTSAEFKNIIRDKISILFHGVISFKREDIISYIENKESGYWKDILLDIVPDETMISNHSFVQKNFTSDIIESFYLYLIDNDLHLSYLDFTSLNNIKKWITGDKLTIYRAIDINLSDIKSINKFDGIGEFWSYDKKTAHVYDSDFGKYNHTIILEAIIESLSDIHWKETIFKALYLPHEQEIELQKGLTVFLKNTYLKNNSKIEKILDNNYHILV
jgi:hypothetical protein